MRLKISGRYFRQQLGVLINSINRAGIVSKKRTDSERAAGYIDYSLNSDFHENFRPREHGYDSHSIAAKLRANLDPMIVEETRQQEAEYLREVIEALDEYRRTAEARLSEIDTESGSLILLERKREIREASNGQKVAEVV